MNFSFSKDLKKTQVTLGRGAPGQTGPMEQPGTKGTIAILDLRNHKVQRVLQELMVMEDLKGVQCIYILCIIAFAGAKGELLLQNAQNALNALLVL